MWVRWLAGTAGLSLIAVVAFALGFARGPHCISSWVVKNSGSDVLCASSFPEPLGGAGLSTLQVDRLNRRLRSAVDFFTVFAPSHFMRPFELILEPYRFSQEITPERLRLSNAIALLPGQLEKAVAKIWLLQNAPSVAQERLAYEAVSDVLSAMMNGSLNLRDPFEGVRLEWGAKSFTAATSLEGFCTSRWRQTETEPFCGALLSGRDRSMTVAKRLFAGSLRADLGERLWRGYSAKGALDRPELIEDWLEHLHTLERFDSEMFLNNWDQASALLNQMERILTGVYKNSEGFSAELLITLDRPATRDDLRRFEALAENIRAEIVIVRGTSYDYLLPNTTPLSLTAEPIHARTQIHESCRNGDLAMLPRHHVKGRILAVRNCGNKAIKYESFFAEKGPEKFAEQNPDVAFAVLRGNGIRVLEKWGVHNPLRDLNRFFVGYLPDPPSYADGALLVLEAYRREKDTTPPIKL